MFGKHTRSLTYEPTETASTARAANMTRPWFALATLHGISLNIDAKCVI